MTIHKTIRRDALAGKLPYQSPNLANFGTVSALTAQTSTKTVNKNENNGHPDGYN